MTDATASATVLIVEDDAHISGWGQYLPPPTLCRWAA